MVGHRIIDPEFKFQPMSKAVSYPTLLHIASGYTMYINEAVKQ